MIVEPSVSRLAAFATTSEAVANCNSSPSNLTPHLYGLEKVQAVEIADGLAVACTADVPALKTAPQILNIKLHE